MRAIVLTVCTVAMLIAAPAFNQKRHYAQPDGTGFNATPQGDEYLHWIEDEAGNILLFNEESGQYEFAEIRENQLRASGVSATSASFRRSAPNLDKNVLRNLWQAKRAEALSNRKR